MGGFGGNTGVQDAHNLAWKIALVLKGLAGPDLLATYNSERQPVGELAIQQAYTRYVLRVVPERGKEGMQPLVDDLSMEIGYRYHSPAIASEAGTGAALYENPRRSKGCPARGRRMCRSNAAAARISTLDLFGKNFCVLAAADGGGYCDAARDAAADLGLPIDCLSRRGGRKCQRPRRPLRRRLWLVRFGRRHRSAGRLRRLARQRCTTRFNGNGQRRAAFSPVPERTSAGFGRRRLIRFAAKRDFGVTYR